MNDSTALLNQLRIDRSADLPESGVKKGSLVIAAAVVAVLGAASVGWTLLSKPAETAAAAAGANVDASAPAPVPAPGATMLDASGYVVARRSATVSSKRVGRVMELLIEEGQRVKRGQIIARLDDSNTRVAVAQARAAAQQAQASLDGARVALEDALPIFQRNERQIAAKVISAQAFDNARATFNAVQSDYNVRASALEVAKAALLSAERDQEDTVVRAPFDGVITVKAAQPGEIVSPQSAGGGFTRTGIGTIVDMESLEVEVDVSENFINRVRADQPAAIRLNAYPDWEIPAAVIAVIPTADRSKATVRVRVGFKQKDARILPEMGARVSFLNAALPAVASNAATHP